MLRLVGHLGRDAVVLYVLDLETARVEGIAVAVAVVARQAGGELDHIVERGKLVVVQYLARDHGDRLRGLAQ
ncbi:hypothetical protein D3C77_560440 [compost metagenome]